MMDKHLRVGKVNFAQDECDVGQLGNIIYKWCEYRKRGHMTGKCNSVVDVLCHAACAEEVEQNRLLTKA